MANMNNIPWWQWVPGRSWRIVSRVDAADEVPAKLPRNAVVLVGSDRFQKWLVFDCPCRSGHRVMLNLDSGRFPHWRITNLRKLTVTPSVDWHGNGKSCHYFIRAGRVVWAHDKEARL
jgi:hypothetical protein